MNTRRTVLPRQACPPSTVSVVVPALLAIAISLLSPPLLFAAEETSRTGLTKKTPQAFQGYTLFAPIRSTTTYLIDIEGQVVHTWSSELPPGHAVYLLDNGHLLRAARDLENQAFHGGGSGGLIQEFDWDGNLVWEFDYSDENHCQHHDIEPMDNGNVLILAWERKSREEAIAAGRNPQNTDQGELWPDHVIEVQPDRPRGGRIVWEWHVWDHLIQDHDSTKAHFGKVDKHPELININFDAHTVRVSPGELDRLRSLGYVGGPPRRHMPEGMADFNHTNSIDYNPKLDQIILSVLGTSEFWVIDHSTTTEEAAGHKGGRYGMGGDILYRWGNPQSYGWGEPRDQRLFAQHDAQWIEPGHPGEGHILVFNNGRGRAGGNYSTVDEIEPPLRDNGKYKRKSAERFGPDEPVWVYKSTPASEFFSGHISGAQRLANGNTLVCAGEQGCIFEVDPSGKTVWEYVNPFGGVVGPGMGPGGRFPPGLPPNMRGPRGKFPSGPPSGPDTQPRRGPGRGPDGAEDGPGDGPRHRRRGGPDRPAGEKTSLFRATRLSPDHPGLAGRQLIPMVPQPVPEPAVDQDQPSPAPNPEDDPPEKPAPPPNAAPRTP